jgi:indolepyruvate ferredoxin oxidoreductase
MAPPFLSRPKNGEPPKKIRLGGWMLPAMKWLAMGKRLRGTPLDPFGHTTERRLERSLIAQFEARLDALATELSPANQKLAAQIAAMPLAIRGYGHVKLANLAVTRSREAELLHRFSPTRYPRPATEPKAGQIRGIAVVAG